MGNYQHGLCGFYLVKRVQSAHLPNVLQVPGQKKSNWRLVSDEGITLYFNRESFQRSSSGIIKSTPQSRASNIYTVDTNRVFVICMIRRPSRTRWHHTLPFSNKRGEIICASTWFYKFTHWILPTCIAKCSHCSKGQQRCKSSRLDTWTKHCRVQ